MLQKNVEKENRKNRETWVGYYSRISKDKTKYNRKKEKNKIEKSW